MTTSSPDEGALAQHSGGREEAIWSFVTAFLDEYSEGRPGLADQ
jgi:hypothetical protein